MKVNILSIDINLDDICYAIYKIDTNNYKRIFIDRMKWNIAEWLRVRKINDYAQKRYGNPARRLWRKLKLRNTGFVKGFLMKLLKML